MAALLGMLWIIFSAFTLPFYHCLALLTVFASATLLLKCGRSAILGWSRLSRLHRLIEEERWEIEHHRPQEKEELIALYKAKGFSGDLLDEVIERLACAAPGGFSGGLFDGLA